MDGAPAPIHDVAALAERLRAATVSLKFSRHELRNHFDIWLQEAAIEDGPVCFLHAVISAADACGDAAPPFDPANDQDALALALASLRRTRAVLAFMSAALAAGFFDEREAREDADSRSDYRTSVMAVLTTELRKLDSIDENVLKAELQSMTGQLQAFDDNQIWIDPGRILPATVLARRRLCRITAVDRFGKKERGTGFLIGPSAVLTNFHVVDALAGGTPLLTGSARILCEFDYSETTGQKRSEASAYEADPSWCIAHSEVGPIEPDGAADAWWEDRGTREAWMAGLTDKLDYAVIRLNASPGLQRGWYRIADGAGAFRQSALAFHHPGGADQTLSQGDIVETAPEDVRIFHRAGTTVGSSGALVLNQDAVPVGLHYLGFYYPNPNDPTRQEIMNVAVSLSHIAEDLKAKNVIEQVAESQSLAPFRGCLDGQKPIFGRKGLLKDLKTMLDDNDKRLMMVHVDPSVDPVTRPGKSFTIDIVKAIFRSSEHHHIVFRAGETQAEALEMAKETIETFAPDLKDDIPKIADTTTAAYVRTLVNYLGEKIRERLDNKLVWLMIDDLDVHSVSDASGREFLATVYNQIKRIPNLRVILVGLPQSVEVSGVDQDTLVRSAINADDLSELEVLFRDWLLERGARDKGITDETLDILARTVVSYAGTERPLEEMSDFVVTHMAAVADRLFGSATADEETGQ